jgi:integrase
LFVRDPFAQDRVEFATISQWLGHASLNTTMTYVRADINLKRQALLQVFLDAPRPPQARSLVLERSHQIDP